MKYRILSSLWNIEELQSLQMKTYTRLLRKNLRKADLLSKELLKMFDLFHCLTLFVAGLKIYVKWLGGMYLEAHKEEIDIFSSHFVKCWIENFVWNHIIFDVRPNANIEITSGINLVSPSLMRKFQKVWDRPPPKKWSNCAYDSKGRELNIPKFKKK